MVHAAARRALHRTLLPRDTWERHVTRALLPRDTWERHVTVSRLGGEPRSVLDVGGVLGQLQAFFPRAEVTSVNVEGPTDVLFDGETLPFDERGFDLVTSLDVLEHIERDRRARHVAELLRVARLRVVLCCPLGTPEHDAAERELADWCAARSGARHRFLDEHLERGLPREAELRGHFAAAGAQAELCFQGDFRATAAELKRLTASGAPSRPAVALRYLRRRAGRRSAPGVSRTATPHANRVFAVAAPARPAGATHLPAAGAGAGE